MSNIKKVCMPDEAFYALALRDLCLESMKGLSKSPGSRDKKETKRNVQEISNTDFQFWANIWGDPFLIPTLEELLQKIEAIHDKP